ncbi:MAG: acyl--CoA ligase [Proteobacteria bacterium]|nr:acyl--CoA ligase [Pseudomonadota bacterium]
MTNLFQFLENNAHSQGDRIAFTEYKDGCLQRSFSWIQIRDCTRRIALSLVNETPGSKVMAVMGNRCELLCTILGGIWADQWIIPLPAETPPAQLNRIAEELSISQIIGDKELIDSFGENISKKWDIEDFTLDKGGCPEGDPGNGKGSLLLQSSGTTGAPKTVRRDADSLIADGKNICQGIGITERDTLLSVVPLYHSYGIDNSIMAATLSGCNIEIHDRFIPSVIHEVILEGRVSVMPAVPIMLDALTRGFDAGDKAKNLRQVYSAGSPLSANIAEGFNRHYGVRPGQIYGASEFGSVYFNDGTAEPYRPDSIGYPFKDVKVRIVDQQGSNTVLSPGEEGEIAIAAPSMMTEYIDHAQKPDKDGFLLTGDLGFIDKEGRLNYTGRIKLLIDVAGLKVNPLEVEAVLKEHPSVSDAIVIPIRYSETASRLKAIIVPEEGADIGKKELQNFAGKQLIHYKIPRVFEFRFDVPRSPTGKILRQKLLPS